MDDSLPEIKRLKQQLRIYTDAFKQYNNINNKYTKALDELQEIKSELQATNETLERKVTERTEALLQKEHFLQSIIDGMSEPVVVINTDFTINMMNTRVQETYLSHDIADPKHPKCYEVIQGRSLPCDEVEVNRINCPLRAMFQSPRDLKTLYTNYEFKESAREFEALSAPLLDVEGNLSAIIQTHRDITEHIRMREHLKRQKEELDYQAHFDSLTTLPNRLFFNEHLTHAIKKSRQSHRKIALFFIDLDKFKQVNDTLGHDYGDKVLCEASTRMQQTLRIDDMLFRLGGDEFTIVMENITSPEDASILAQRINTIMEDPIFLENETLYVSNSIGISIYPDDAQNAADLLRFADAAMYKAKEEGRNTFRFYSSRFSDKISKEFDLANNLRKAILNEEFEVHYQPQIDSRTKKLIGMEALVRWNRPGIGTIVPGDFIPLAEETGLIVMIDDIVMRHAMKEFSQWIKDGLNPGILALNISIKRLESDNFLSILRHYLDIFGLDPSHLELEITESDIMRKPEENTAKLNQIRQMGITIAIDDFGTGYSSLSYLKKLPVSKLKIDQSFIRDLPHSDEDAQITKAIVAMSHSLNLETIAEGVETAEQEAFLLQYTCDDMQGFLYSKPINAEAMHEFLLRLRS